MFSVSIKNPHTQRMLDADEANQMIVLIKQMLKEQEFDTWQATQILEGAIEDIRNSSVLN